MLRKPREIRFCGCDCGGSKEVPVNSPWKYFAGHNLRVNNPMERPELVAKMANTYENLSEEEKNLYDTVKNLAEATKIKGAYNTRSNAAGSACNAAWLNYAIVDSKFKLPVSEFYNKFRQVPAELAEIVTAAHEAEQVDHLLSLATSRIFEDIKRLLFE